MSTSKVSPLNARSEALSLPLDSTHVVQFYDEEHLLIEELTRLIGTSLLGGDSAIVIASKSHRDALAHELAARGFNIAKAASEGRYIPLDAQETLSKIIVDEMPEPVRLGEFVEATIKKAKAASKRDDSSVVVFGEMVALLWFEGKHEAAIRLEELWNTLAETHAFSLHCAYPMKSFHKDSHADLFSRVCAEHSAVLPLGSHRLVLSDNERLRAIAKLQQQLEVLEYEKALRASEQRFRILVDAVQDYAIFMLDVDGCVISWNIGAERLKGYKASDIIGQHFSRFYPEEDVRSAKPQRELEIAIQEGRVEDEGWRVRKDGSKFWANVIITALKDQNGAPIGFAKVTRDFTEKMQSRRALEESERRLRLSEKSLRNLSLHLLRTQDEERRRIGRDLHDSLGQYLSVLKMKLDCLEGAAARKHSDDLADLKECAQLAEDAVKEVRTISYLLYPPMLEEMGLQSAIPWYLEGFAKRSGIKTTFEASPDFCRLAPDVELAFFRVLQESLTNVHRHSGSPTAEVRLTLNGAAILEVRDQGNSSQLGHFEETDQDWTGALGVGLRGMNERMEQVGGSLKLSSTKKGTTVTAAVPLDKARTVASN